MDELEWLKEHSPSTRPSRDITRRHRTQLRAAIAAEGADGARPRRPRRERRSRHRVLVTTTLVVALCAVGAGVVALTSSGSEHGSTVGAPASSEGTTTAPVQACPGGPPKELAIPAGFGTGVAVPSAKQQITSWSSDQATIEQRWPADAAAAAKFGSLPGSGDSISSGADQHATVDDKGIAHRTIVFTFGSQSPDCATLQVSVTGSDVAAVDSLANSLITAPFRSIEPLVSTTGAAASAPAVVACEGVLETKASALAVPAVAAIGGPVALSTFAKPAHALADFITSRPTLARSGYQELRLDDSSVVYVKAVRSNVVTTVHVAPTTTGWTVTDWQASGC
jgi:hypothetical protein